jgi:hypothetical protein
MQYRHEAAEILAQIIERLQALDRLTDAHPSHKLDYFEPLTVRLENIRADLLKETSLLPATRKTNELRARLIGGIWGLDDPKYRSTLAALLGSYQRQSKPPKAKLGGLRGGRPRKDGLPTQTLEKKGYSAEFLPPTKGNGLRVHPTAKQGSVGSEGLQSISTMNQNPVPGP